MTSRHSPARPGTLGRIAPVIWCLLDSTLWFTSVYLATWLRYDFSVTRTVIAPTLWAGVGAAVGHALMGTVFGAYTRNNIRASFDEVRGLGASSLVVTMGLAVVALLAMPIVLPRTVPLIGGLSAFSLMLAARFTVRSVREARAVNQRGKTPIIVFGAGNAGRLLVHNLLNDPESFYLPVALLDDDRTKRRARIEGIRVQGTREDIERVSAHTGAQHLVIAIPSAAGQTVGELRDAAECAGVKPLVVPSLSRLAGHGLTGRDIRDIDLEDLLGRTAIRLDAVAISGQVNHRVVLVTGAGGSIGAELCRQLRRFNPTKLVMLDRDESALHALEIDLVGNGLLENRNTALADIRDPDALLEIFLEHRPDIVFHAAALKHLPLLESYPLEAWKSNVLGTLNVLAAAGASGVTTFVNISTDKAADPTSVLGYSKRVGERLTAGFAARYPGRYLSVRFGNVLASRGSVIPAFQAQIRRGGPVTVTHPDVERYFMLIPEACQLVMQAAAIGLDGEVMVLDMGEQVRIDDLAKTLISMSGRSDIEITYSGLRPGEKLTESLFSRSDEDRPTSHPLVTAVEVPPLDPGVVAQSTLDPSSALTWMRRIAVDMCAGASLAAGSSSPNAVVTPLRRSLAAHWGPVR